MSDSDNLPPEPPRPPRNGAEPDPDERQPGLSPSLQPNVLDMQQLKKAQTLVMVANIAGPVSLFLGGVLLSTVGLVCAIVANSRLKQLVTRTTRVGAAAALLKRSSAVGIVLCAIALVLNGISFFILLPEVMQMMESGDYAGFAMDPGSGAAGSSTWG
ncbi:hypothetical protein [Arabiibacter massiliensis]|uniref:hypothetical protein n=1 Tax=Arabiibacter massiliensis TaxID=1870985 RepID=UPI001E5827E3|nr:hypothetical protein [Arabiibacter massiliensis]